VAVDIDTEQDVERLREMAQILQGENHRLYLRLEELARQLAEATGQDAIKAIQLELRLAQEQVEKNNRALFARSSEKRGGAKKRHAGHGPAIQPPLPVVEEVHVLDEPDRVCPECGGDLREMTGQYEEADEIGVIERSFRIVRHKRQKYVCRCGECVDTALGPPKLIAGGRYAVDFAVAVAIAKYLDQSPLARQERQMAREGLIVSRQTLWDQLYALCEHLEPTADALHAYVLSADIVQADETRWPLLGTEGASKWHAWAVAREDAISYRILGSRSLKAAGEVLGGFHGTAVTDGYAVYEALSKSRDGPGFTLAHCWAHTRRKYVDAAPSYPKANEMVEKIGVLYAIEARADEAGVNLEVRAEMRRTESRAVVDDIYRWITTEPALPKSLLGKAIGYTQRLWPGLVRFVDDARLPLDTNLVERGMRGPAIGRKNHYGSRSMRGTKVAAQLYSLVETAKLAGIDPREYLAEATRRAIANPGTVTLPRDFLSI
jgi:transposase